MKAKSCYKFCKYFGAFLFFIPLVEGLKVRQTWLKADDVNFQFIGFTYSDSHYTLASWQRQEQKKFEYNIIDIYNIYISKIIRDMREKG